MFENALKLAQEKFPDLKVKYKNESLLMKIISYILFFNKDFMTSYTTVIGSTIYYPNAEKISQRPITSVSNLLHELVHINDSKKYSRFLFTFMYLFPQILFPLFLLLAIFGGWFFIIPAVICLLPIPAPFRMIFEKRAYIISLYTLYKLGQKFGFDPKLEQHCESYLSYFKDSSYYFMWFFDMNKEFDNCLFKIKNNERPFVDSFFDDLDEIIEKI